MSRSTYAKGLKWGVGFILLSWILTLVFILGLAFVITLLNRPLSWFARPIWIFFLYIIPTFLTSIFVAQAFKKKFNTVSFSRTILRMRRKMEIIIHCVFQLISLPSTISTIYYDSNICIFTTISAFLTLSLIRSNFIVSIWLAFSFSFWILKTKFTWFNKGLCCISVFIVHLSQNT